jgi:hypothetical protein
VAQLNPVPARRAESPFLAVRRRLKARSTRRSGRAAPREVQKRPWVPLRSPFAANHTSPTKPLRLLRPTKPQHLGWRGSWWWLGWLEGVKATHNTSFLSRSLPGGGAAGREAFFRPYHANHVLLGSSDSYFWLSGAAGRPGRGTLHAAQAQGLVEPRQSAPPALL